MTTLEITQMKKVVTSDTGKSVSMLGKLIQRVGRSILYVAAAITPQPRKIEVRMSDGSVLRNIPVRVWERHSALISASYESQKRREP